MKKNKKSPKHVNNNNIQQQYNNNKSQLTIAPAFPFSQKTHPTASLETIIPSQIYLIQNFFSLQDCLSLIAYSESFNFTPADPTLKPKKGFAFRDNDRISFISPEFANSLYAKLSPFLDTVQLETDKSPTGLNPQIRFYKYTKGQKFGQHYDESIVLESGTTEFTALFYLNGGEDVDNTLVGGETVFYESKRKEVFRIAPQMGLVLLHRHGQRCLLHEALEVLKGVKYVLRSDLIFS